MMLAAAPLLVISLFLAWSHQFSSAVLARYGSSSALRGVARSPDAWQVYSAVDVILAVLALALIAAGLRGGRTARWVVAGAMAVALVFTVHALSAPPTNGAVLFDSTARPPAYIDTMPGAGPGETLALVALSLGMAGLLLSFTADP